MLNRLLFLLIFIPSFLLGQSSVSSSFAELFVDQSILLFDSGKADLPMEADSLLQPCLDALSKDPTLRVRVRAHTDNIGSVAYNKQLSERRANAVLARLFALGVDSSQVIAQGFGEEEPEATNQTEDGRQTNRRATVEVFQPVRMLPLRGAIIDAETKKPLIGQILIRGRYFRDSLQTDTLGIYETFVPENSNLVIETFSEGYFFETAMLQMKTEPIELPQIALPKIKPGVSFDLKNFYFVGNQAVLLERSEPELNRLLKFMQFNPTTL
ncbi:MAG: OmpA family protein, partial [Bacteroidota bacterium]